LAPHDKGAEDGMVTLINDDEVVVGVAIKPAHKGRHAGDLNRLRRLGITGRDHPVRDINVGQRIRSLLNELGTMGNDDAALAAMHRTIHDRVEHDRLSGAGRRTETHAARPRQISAADIIQRALLEGIKGRDHVLVPSPM
jgi:hypothetical protein